MQSLWSVCWWSWVSEGTQGAVWWHYTGWQCVLYFSSMCLFAARMLSWERSGVQLQIPPAQSTVISCWWVNSMKGLFVLVGRITAPSSVLDTGSGAGAGRIIIFLPGFSVLSISGAVREKDVVASDWRRHLFMKRWRQVGNTTLTFLGVVIIVEILRTLLRFLYDRGEIIQFKTDLKVCLTDAEKHRKQTSCCYQGFDWSGWRRLPLWNSRTGCPLCRG